MLIALLAMVVGFIGLVWGADRFVSGAAGTALHFGVSKAVIGLTVVALGTSMPEVLVSVAAAVDGNPLLAVGNAVGSNIVNIGMVLGLTAMVVPLPFSRGVLRTELPWLLITTGGVMAMCFNLNLSRIDGLILLAGLTYVMYRLARSQLRSEGELTGDLAEELDELPELSRGQALFWLVVGLAVLLVSARVLVWGAVEMALLLGVSELVIGLTVVAAGTSLPELAATFGAAVKGHSEMAIGNIVGSNLFNLLCVLPIPALVSAPAVGIDVLWRDCGMMLAMTVALALFAYAVGSRPVITRFEGAVLLLAWVGYTLVLLEQVPS